MMYKGLFWADPNEIDWKTIKKELRVIGRNTRDQSRIIEDCWVEKDGLVGIPRSFAKIKDIKGKEHLREIKADWPEIDFQPRHNQAELLRDGIKELEKNNAVYFSSPTNFGKTILAVRLAQLLGTNCIILCHRENILKQFENAIKEVWGIDCGWVHGKKYDVSKLVTLAMVPTLARRCDNLPEDFWSSFGTTIYDEAHHFGASTYLKVATKFENKYTIGLSATFRRKDKLDKVFKIFFGNQLEGLISNPPKKYLYCPKVPCDINMKKCIDWRNGEFSIHLFREEFMKQKSVQTWLEQILKYLVENNRRIVVFFDSLPHIDKVNNSIDLDNGVYAGKLNGKDLKELDLIESCKKDVIFATPGKMGEGLDLSNLLGKEEYDKLQKLDTCINLFPCDDTEQQTGRVGRNMWGDEIVLAIHPIYDARSARKLDKCKKTFYFDDKHKFKEIKDLSELFG